MNMGGFDPSQARNNLNNRTQSPAFAPGMQAPTDMNMGGVASNPFGTAPNPFGGAPAPLGGGTPAQSPFTGGVQMNDANQGIGALNTPPLGAGSPFSTQPMAPSPMMQPQQMKSTEDKIWDVAAASGKAGINMFKDILTSYKGLTPTFWKHYGFQLSVAGAIIALLGIIVKIFGFADGFLVTVGGLVCLLPALPLWLLNVNRPDDTGEEFQDAQPDPNEYIEQAPMSDFDSDSDFDSEDFGDDEEDWADDEEEEEEDDWDDFSQDSIKQGASDGMDAETALSSMQDVPKGMYTKQFLYENFIKVLPTYAPQFAKFKTYNEESDAFLFWSDLVMQAGELQGFDEDTCPYLMELCENAFIIKVTVSRNAKLKAAQMADELAVAYAHNMYPDDQEKRAGVFATTETIMNKCVFTIFTGSSPFIALKDIYKSCEDFVLSRDTVMPIVLGTNELGVPIKMDFKSVESLITAGMPRSGKSWFVQNLLTQLCALNSPSDVNLYFLDPKAATSDYYKFKLPHVKCFASQYRDTVGNVFNKEFPSILATLRTIVNKEAPRRKKLLGDAGCVNIGDFRKKYPDVNLPYLYIVIDEMVTLSQMLKEDESEYQSYLDQIVTQFPNLGIRGIFIPHEVKNQIMSKTASDSVKGRISVRGDEKHIEASTGTKPTQFRYKLSFRGDMAVRIDEVSSATVFVHAGVLTDDNDKNNEIFDYLRRLWLKLEPDSFADSIAVNADVEKQNQAMLNNINNGTDDFLDDLEDIDLFADE